MADRIKLRPHQIATGPLPEMTLLTAPGIGKSHVTDDFISDLSRAQPGAMNRLVYEMILNHEIGGKPKKSKKAKKPAHPLPLVSPDRSGSMEGEPMTAEERAAVNRGIDDMINNHIVNDARVAEVYAKLRSGVAVPTAVERAYNALKGDGK